MFNKLTYLLTYLLNHGDRDSVIFLQPYSCYICLWLGPSLARCVAIRYVLPVLSCQNYCRLRSRVVSTRVYGSDGVASTMFSTCPPRLCVRAFLSGGTLSTCSFKTHFSSNAFICLSVHSANSCSCCVYKLSKQLISGDK